MTTPENVVPIKAPMTAREFRDAKRALEAEIGSSGRIIATMDDWSHGKDDKAIKLAIYSRYPTGSPVYTHADSWDEALLNCRNAWAVEAEKMRASTIREMALAIIKFTHEYGECTDAHLRQDFFSDHMVKTLGDEACALAAVMGGRSPFTITKTAKSNAA